MISTVLAGFAAFAVSWALDPRKFRTGLYLLAALIWLPLEVTGLILGTLDNPDDLTGAWVLLAGLTVTLAAILTFAAFLIASGVTLLRREGRRLAHTLGVGLGSGLTLFVGAGVVAVATSSRELVVLLLLLGLPAGYLGIGFAAFLLYGWLYPEVAARRNTPVTAVIILGSGLIRGRVTPLLAARLERGKHVYETSRRAGLDTVIVVSGGKGDDEPVAEATAMATYLTDRGVPESDIVAETQSRNTEQNLQFSAELLAQKAISGPVAVVSNNFHALRAALLMRKKKLPGYSIGAPTATYYWSAAVIREYIAILRDHRWLNATILAVLSIPALATLISTATRILSTVP